MLGRIEIIGWLVMTCSLAVPPFFRSYIKKIKGNESVLLCSASRFTKEHFFCGGGREVPKLCPCVLLVWVTCRWRWLCCIGGMLLAGENWSTRRETSPSATLTTTNPTWTGPGSNLPPPPCERLVISPLYRGTTKEKACGSLENSEPGLRRAGDEMLTIRSVQGHSLQPLFSCALHM